MPQRIAPKSTRTAQAIAIPMEQDEFFGQARAQQATGYSFYPWAVALRIGFLGILLFNAFAFWYS
jgi:hypothetical protein